MRQIDPDHAYKMARKRLERKKAFLGHTDLEYKIRNTDERKKLRREERFRENTIVSV